MSVEINFNTLKYNLYELLNVPSNADETKIKRQFLRIIKNFHPDKNSKLEEEIYFHIILANQVLLNKESRQKYDDYINTTANTFEELKTSFRKSIDILNKNSGSADYNSFKSNMDKLNKKHGYNDFSDENIIDKFNKVKNNRDKIISNIKKEEFKNTDEFNKKFADSKKQEQIVEYKGDPTEISTYVIGENYTTINDLDKLYLEDSVQCSKFSSLDRAFMLQPNFEPISNIPLDQKLKERIKEREKL